MHILSFVTNVPAAPNSGAFWSAFAVLGAAIIASMIALVGHWIAKSNTVLQVNLGRDNAKLAAQLSINSSLADMRQKWINTLRDDLADFQALILAAKPGTESEKIRHLENRIKMLMNPQDPDYPTLESLVDVMVKSKLYTAETFDNAAYVAVCQSILKREWDRLKADMQIV